MKLTEGQMWYHTYLASRQWEKTKRKILRNRLYVCQIPGCSKRSKLQFHHLSYDNVNNEVEDDIVIVCRTHHYLCHYKWFGTRKIPYTKQALTKRFQQLSKYRWGRLRPSHIFHWFYESYRI